MDKQKQIDNLKAYIFDLSETNRIKLFWSKLNELMDLVEEKAYKEGRDADHKEYMEAKSRLEDTIKGLKGDKSEDNKLTYEQVYPKGNKSVID